MSDDQEIKFHRQAVEEIHKRCKGFDSWVCAEALLYVVDGDKIVERLGLWVVPSANERFLISTSYENGGVDEYYILVRLQGKNCLDKLSLGVCRTHSGKFSPSFQTPGAPLDVDPTMGHVIRIISIERDGAPLHRPEDADPTLSNARHIRDVVRKAGKPADLISASSTLHNKFGTLRTREYMRAKEMLAEDCSPEEWGLLMQVLEDPASFPWGLAEKLSEMGTEVVGRMTEAENRLLPCGKLHVYEDIWLVDESLPLESNKLMTAGRWAVKKSIQGAGSIPRAKLWDSVVMHEDYCSRFILIRLA